MIILSPMVFTQFTGVFPARTFTPLLTPSSRNLHHAIPTIPSYRISSLALVPVQITELDEVLQDREVRARAILDADRDDRRRNIMSPPPAPAPPRIGLGGAVLRRGDRQVNFPSNRPTRFEDQAVPPPIRAQDPPPQVNGDRNYAALLERLANVENDRGGEDRDPMAYRRGLAAIYNQLGRGEALAMGLMPDPALQLAHPVPIARLTEYWSGLECGTCWLGWICRGYSVGQAERVRGDSTFRVYWPKLKYRRSRRQPQASPGISFWTKVRWRGHRS